MTTGDSVQSPEVTLLFVHSKAMGYGRYGTYLAEEIAKLGVDLFTSMDTSLSQYQLEMFSDGSEQRSKKTNVAAWVATPGHFRGAWEGQQLVLSTMYETNYLPEGFRERLGNFDTVVVPSEQNVELFGAYHPNVVKVPLGVDTKRWFFHERQEPTTEFRFLCAGSGPRKGTDLAARAFRKVFPDGSWGPNDPVPILTMKSVTPDPYDPFGPRITRVAGYITGEAEADLYASAHCYLGPARGEGFGLMPLQAMAQGIPTILTNAHGHADFAWLGLPLDSSLVEAAYFIHGQSGEWWEPDFDQLCDMMRWVYDNYARAAADAQMAAGVIHREWGWEHTARRFVDAVGGMDALTTPYNGSGEWKDCFINLYRVRTLETRKLEVAGSTMICEAGLDYWQSADVKRIMFEAGWLDPDCWTREEDSGLTPDQVERAQKMQGEDAYCPMCQQKLNSGVKRGDKWFAELEAKASTARPNVTLCSMFRDSSAYISRYFDQIGGLREFVNVRLVLAEGDSTDGTNMMIRQCLAPGDHLIKVDHGGPVFGSADNPERWRNIAIVVRALLAEVGDPGDAFIWVESDLVWEPAMLARLLVDLEEVPSAAPMLLANDHRRFYDVWGYRKNGERFEGAPPYHPWLGAKGLTPIDSCGSCFVARPEVFKRLVSEWDGHWPAKPEGLHVNAEVEVIHP